MDKERKIEIPQEQTGLPKDYQQTIKLVRIPEEVTNSEASPQSIARKIYGKNLGSGWD